MIYKFILAASLPLFAGIGIYLLFKGREKVKRTRVSNEGYETAYDVLFPKKKIKKYRVS
jgi:hypothetical protein